MILISETTAWRMVVQLAIQGCTIAFRISKQRCGGLELRQAGRESFLAKKNTLGAEFVDLIPPILPLHVSNALCTLLLLSKS
jgi:hypothetical protein